MASLYIDREECIGDSLVKINSNFTSLDSSVTTGLANLQTLINTLSTNMMNFGNFPYLEYAWVTAPNVAGQAITANTITTLYISTKLADLGSYGTLTAGSAPPAVATSSFTLDAGTYSYEAYTGWDFGGSGGGAMASFGLYNITSGSYVSRTGPTAATGAGFYSLKLNGQFTINTTTVFDIRGWSNSNFKVHNSGGDNPSGSTPSTANADQRTTIKLWKVG